MFSQEPPGKVHFSNSTGSIIPCVIRGNPNPKISWETVDGLKVNDVNGLRHQDPSGSLVFPPFSPNQYSQDIHATIYRCIGQNVVSPFFILFPLNDMFYCNSFHLSFKRSAKSKVAMSSWERVCWPFTYDFYYSIY